MMLDAAWAIFIAKIVSYSICLGVALAIINKANLKNIVDTRTQWRVFLVLVVLAGISIAQSLVALVATYLN
jgi:hypothetical protein